MYNFNIQGEIKMAFLVSDYMTHGDRGLWGITSDNEESAKDWRIYPDFIFHTFEDMQETIKLSDIKYAEIYCAKGYVVPKEQFEQKLKVKILAYEVEA